MTANALRQQVFESVKDIGAEHWNALAPADLPFTQHGFFCALEESGCIGSDSGWQPQYLGLFDTDEQLVALTPLFLKTHSWGEFVFDWGWAQAYEEHGLPYYPKVLSAIPFTPASTPKLWQKPGSGPDLRPQLIGAAENLARTAGASSVHWQFVDSVEQQNLSRQGYLIREDCQFHWHNRNYQDFDGFLAQFSSVKRKKVRRERRRIQESGIHFEHRQGAQIGESDWHDAFDLTRTTFLLRGREPYLNLRFFETAWNALPEMFRLSFACYGTRRIAAAVCFVGTERLYGRYWGADAAYHSLHFETCYYQGIDYCIEAGLAVFEPGTQGEHKISRGFLPMQTLSAHKLFDPRFHSALDRHVRLETKHVQDYAEQVEAHSPFRRDIE
ncbi:MAG: GNAT family N-acetyltransferase [Pseudomonadota bacterium]